LREIQFGCASEPSIARSTVSSLYIATKELTVLVTSVPCETGWHRDPFYTASSLTWCRHTTLGGTRELRQFQADPHVTVRLSDIGYDVLQVEARDGRQPDKPPLKAAFDWQYLGWLDAAGEQAAGR
jgi:hypothetical protein